MSVRKSHPIEPYQTQLLQPLSACVVRPLRVGYYHLRHGYATDPQVVPWHTLGFTVKGQAEYKFLYQDGETERVVVGPGCRIWLPQGTIRSVEVLQDGLVLYSFQFAIVGDIHADVYGLPDDFFTQPKVHAQRDTQETILYRRLHQLWMIRTPSCLMQAQGVALELLAHLYNTGTTSGVSPHMALKVNELVHYMSEHYSDPDLNLARLAEQTEWTPKYLSHVFRLVTGTPPMRFLQRLRIEQSLELLESGTLSVPEVAIAVGFRDPSYFTRVFRQYLGVPPSELILPRYHP